MADIPAITLPDRLTPELRDILGFMCFQAAPIAHGYQAAGRFVDGDGSPLEKRAEDEQAFVIHRMLIHWTRSGAGWRESMGEELEEVFCQAMEAKAKSHG